MADTIRTRKSGAGCPLCGKPPSAEARPFCSRGCKDRDLLKWLGEGYRIEGPPAPPSDIGEDAQE